MCKNNYRNAEGLSHDGDLRTELLVQFVVCGRDVLEFRQELVRVRHLLHALRSELERLA